MQIKRVQLRNYKSIQACAVELRPLTFLVGPNGAGKSNFVDALCFVRDALRNSLDYAIRDRGGVNEVRRRSGGHPTHFGIRIDFRNTSGEGHYAFEVGALPSGGFEVKHEQLKVRERGRESYFNVESGKVVSASEDAVPAAARDRLYLVNASGLPSFRAVYESLSAMGFYNLNPKLIRDLQEPDEGTLLDRYGGNLASVLARLERQSPSIKTRIEAYLSKVVPSVHGVEFKEMGPRHTIQFRQDVAGQKHAWRFWASSMSDGTLRTLGILAAIFQSTNEVNIPLVAIEEPETALHPAAAGILLDSLREASQRTQILVTSHSADLLDRQDIDIEGILSVAAVDGVTKIAPVDKASRETLRTALFTPGELLRLDQLTPDTQLFDQLTQQLALFDT